MYIHENGTYRNIEIDEILQTQDPRRRYEFEKEFGISTREVFNLKGQIAQFGFTPTLQSYLKEKPRFLQNNEGWLHTRQQDGSYLLTKRSDLAKNQSGIIAKDFEKQYGISPQEFLTNIPSSSVDAIYTTEVNQTLANYLMRKKVNFISQPASWGAIPPYCPQPQPQPQRIVPQGQQTPKRSLDCKVRVECGKRCKQKLEKALGKTIPTYDDNNKYYANLGPSQMLELKKSNLFCGGAPLDCEYLVAANQNFLNTVREEAEDKTLQSKQYPNSDTYYIPLKEVHMKKLNLKGRFCKEFSPQKTGSNSVSYNPNLVYKIPANMHQNAHRENTSSASHLIQTPNYVDLTALYDSNIQPVDFYHDGENKPFDLFPNTVRRMPITIEGTTYPSSEHYFQSLKFKKGSPAWEKIVKSQAYGRLPGEVRNLTNSHKEDLSYEFQNPKMYHSRHKIDGMYRAIKAKYEQHKNFQEALKKTGSARITEFTDHPGGNPNIPIDEEWGRNRYTGKGRGLLGNLLMILRAEKIYNYHPAKIQSLIEELYSKP